MLEIPEFINFELFFICGFFNPLSYFASEMGEELKEVGFLFIMLYSI